MSRNKVTRILVALATLFGAIPLMAQAAPAGAAAPGFPFGKYALVAIDTANGPPPGMSVEFKPTSLDVIRGGQVVESHGLSAANGVLEIFTLGGDCVEAGKYKWQITGKVLTLEVVSDPCSNRAMAITSVQFEQQ